MKKFKFGRRVQNWHRPLQAGELKQSYRNTRWNDAEVPDLQQINRGRSFVPQDYSSDYDQYDDYYDDYYSEEDFQLFHLEGQVRDYLRHRELVPRKRAAETSEAITVDGEWFEEHLSLEERLAAHLEVITDSTRYADTLKRLQAVDLPIADREVLYRAGRSPGLETVLFLFMPFWLRSPSSWQPDGKVSLLAHLLQRYPVPSFLERIISSVVEEWCNNRTLYDSDGYLKWFCWYLLLGQGGSLKTASRYFPWQVQGKFQQFLERAPRNFRPEDVCLLAEIQRLGGTQLEYERLTRTGGFQIDPTEPEREEGFQRFWTETVHWLIAHREAITDPQSRDLLTWAMHEFTEGRRNGSAFTWKRRTLASVLRRAEAYIDLIRRPWKDHRWQAHHWDWQVETQADTTWSFVELTTGEELYQEGRTLSHCVAGYALHCVHGNSAIVSMRQNNECRITIQVDMNSLQVVQARGKFNRATTAEEQQLIRRWVSQKLSP